MIISHEEVIKGMEKNEALIEINEGGLREKLTEIAQSFRHLHENADSKMQPFIVQTEHRMYTLLLKDKLSNILENLNYDEIVDGTVRFLFAPKYEKVNDYIVDFLTVFFDIGPNSEPIIQPCYFISLDRKEYLLPLKVE